MCVTVSSSPVPEPRGTSLAGQGSLTDFSTAQADVLVPFYEECGTFISGLSAASFSFDIPAFGEFAGMCRDTRSLTHFANGVCSGNGEELQARVADIQTSCCVQGGVNVCTQGVPWACDAVCAVPVRHCLCLVFPLCSWLRQCLSLRTSSS